MHYTNVTLFCYKFIIHYSLIKKYSALAKFNAIFFDSRGSVYPNYYWFISKKVYKIIARILKDIYILFIEHINAKTKPSNQSILNKSHITINLHIIK